MPGVASFVSVYSPKTPKYADDAACLRVPHPSPCCVQPHTLARQAPRGLAHSKAVLSLPALRFYTLTGDSACGFGVASFQGANDVALAGLSSGIDVFVKPGILDCGGNVEATFPPDRVLLGRAGVYRPVRSGFFEIIPGRLPGLCVVR